MDSKNEMQGFFGFDNPEPMEATLIGPGKEGMSRKDLGNPMGKRGTICEILHPEESEGRGRAGLSRLILRHWHESTGSLDRHRRTSPVFDWTLPLAWNLPVMDLQIEITASHCLSAFKAQRMALKSPPMAVEEFLTCLQRQQLPKTVSYLQQHSELI